MNHHTNLEKDPVKFGFSEFVNRFTELRFRQTSLKEDIEPVKVVVLIIGFAAIAFLYDDYRLQQDTEWWPAVVYLRLLVSVSSFGVYFALKNIRRFTGFECIVLPWVCIVAAATVFTEIIRPPGYTLNLLLDILVLLGIYIFMVLRPIWQIILASIYTLTLVILIAIYKPEYELQTIIGVLVLCNILGIGGSLHIQKLRRQSFAQKTQLNRYSREMKRMAYRDGLTNLWNRRAFDEQVEQHISRFIRYGQLFSLIVVDLDFFKKVNDTYGHDEGDRLLAEFSSFLVEHIRPSDLAYRYGGEEFVVILSDTRADQAEQYVKRMRTQMAAQDFMPHIPELSVTASIGISEIKEGDTGIRSIFLRADKAVYQAKNEGRDTYRVL